MNVSSPLSASPLTTVVPAFPVSNQVGASSPAPTAAGPAVQRASPAQANDGSSSRSVTQGEESPRSGDNLQGLDSAELKQLSELKARDREVRAHEAAHQAVGGRYAGAISYVYERGPDGAQYAVGGEVSIDTAPVNGDPQATIEKMRTVRAAALAPAEPSPQDRAVAAQAMQLMLQAQAELASESGSQGPEGSESTQDTGGPRVNQDASRAYESVFNLGGANIAQDSPVPFQATA